MTEAEWLASTDPGAMLESLRGKAGERELRLFACGCWRLRWRDSVEDRGMLHLGAQVEARADEEAGGGRTAFQPGSEEALASALEIARFTASRRGGGRRVPPETQASLVRCIFGNPFRTTPGVAPPWLDRNDGAARKLAQGIYEEHHFADLPILADALEDAGCDSAEILAHCRSGGEHVRGCWVVDAILAGG